MRKDLHKKVDQAAVRPPKRSYSKPELSEYGSVAKLTQSGGSTNSESGVPMMRGNFCL
jgi:hypothetical protein